jgi:hypothetical protein
MPDGAVVEMPDQLDPALGQRLRNLHTSQTFQPVDLGPQMAPPSAAENAVRTVTAPLVTIGNLARRVAQGMAPAAGLGATALNELGLPVDPNKVEGALTRFLQPHEPESPLEGTLRTAISAPTDAIAGVAHRAEAQLPEPVQQGIDVAGRELSAVAPFLPIGELGELHPGTPPVPRIARAPADVATEAGYKGVVSKADLKTPGATAVTNQLISDDVNLPKGQVPTQDAVIDARNAGPGAVRNQIRDAMPESITPDAQYRAAVGNLRGSSSILPGAPGVGDLQQTMLGKQSMTPEQLFASITDARSQAADYFNSDDPNASAMGVAHSNAARALEDLADRQLPDDSPLKGQMEATRVPFAKSYFAQQSLKGENFDPKAYGKAMAADPSILSGNAAIVGHIANGLPDKGLPGVTGTAGAVGGAAAGMAAEHLVPGAGTLGPLAPLASAYVGHAAAPFVRGVLQRLFPQGDAAAAAATSGNPALSYFFRGNEPEPGFGIAPGYTPNPRGGAPTPPAPPASPPLRLPAPAMVNAGGGVSTASTLADQLGRTPDVVSAGALHPSAARPVVPAVGGQNAPLALVPDAGRALPQGSGFPTLADVMAPRDTVATTASPEAPLGRTFPNAAMTTIRDVHGAVLQDRHVEPGSTLYLQGSQTDPVGFTALTPHEDGSMRMTNTWTSEDARGMGLGQARTLQAAKDMQAQGIPLHADTSVSTAQARVYDFMKRNGQLDYDVTNPEAWNKGLASKKPTTVIQAGKNQPVIKNIRPAAPPALDSWPRLGDFLAQPGA